MLTIELERYVYGPFKIKTAALRIIILRSCQSKIKARNENSKISKFATIYIQTDEEKTNRHRDSIIRIGYCHTE